MSIEEMSTEAMAAAARWARFLALTPKRQTEETLDTMTFAVSEMPHGFRYRAPGSTDVSCVYVKDDEPSCLIGRVLHRLGLPLAALRSMDNSTDAAIALWWPDLGLHRETGAMLTAAQVAQDEGQTWLQAQNAARMLHMAMFAVPSIIE